MLGEEHVINVRSDRFKFGSPGIFGAKPARSSCAAINPGTASERALTSKAAGLRLKRGDLLSWDLAGGGGWGDPYERDPALVARDVRRGYVSREAAARDYGVMLRDDLAVDEAATQRLRAQRERP
jgi:N-methylhydantoinase B